jgi:hypothetical protein
LRRGADSTEITGTQFNQPSPASAIHQGERCTAQSINFKSLNVDFQESDMWLSIQLKKSVNGRDFNFNRAPRSRL